MRIEHEEQMASGPFWMGCTRNILGHEANKATYTAASSSSAISPVHSISALLLGLSLVLQLYALIT